MPVERSILRQPFDPFKDPKDIGMASKIIFSRSYAEKMTALLIPHGAFDTLCKKRKLLCRWLLTSLPILILCA